MISVNITTFIYFNLIFVTSPSQTYCILHMWPILSADAYLNKSTDVVALSSQDSNPTPPAPRNQPSHARRVIPQEDSK